MKQKKIEGSKKYLNCRWGALSQTNKTTLYVDNNSKTETEIYNSKEIDSIITLSKTKTMLKLVSKSKYFIQLVYFIVVSGSNFRISHRFEHCLGW